MFRMWGKTIKDNRILKDYVVEYSHEDTRTHKVFQGLDEICSHFELTRPIWLKKNTDDFKKFSFTRFYQDCFIDEIDFEYLEIRIIEED